MSSPYKWGIHHCHIQELQIATVIVQDAMQNYATGLPFILT